MSLVLRQTQTAGLTVDELKDLCRANKLLLGGNKDELIERIKKHVATGNKLKPAAGLTPADFKEEPDETWPMRTLKALASTLGLKVSGNKEELVARLNEVRDGDNGKDALLKDELVEHLRCAGLKVSGTLPELVERVRNAKEYLASLQVRDKKSVVECLPEMATIYKAELYLQHDTEKKGLKKQVSWQKKYIAERDDDVKDLSNEIDVLTNKVDEKDKKIRELETTINGLSIVAQEMWGEMDPEEDETTTKRKK